jgi:hypothetical protein
MRWILSLILVPLMIVGAVVTTFFLMVMLNGYPSLPDAMVNLYLASACGLILGLSLLAGFLTGKLSEAGKFPGWVIGILAGAAALVLLPLILVTLTFVLLAIFGMLSP